MSEKTEPVQMDLDLGGHGGQSFRALLVKTLKQAHAGLSAQRTKKGLIPDADLSTLGLISVCLASLGEKAGK